MNFPHTICVILAFALLNSTANGSGEVPKVLKPPLVVPFAKGTFDKVTGKPVPWTLDKVHKYRDEAIGSIEEGMTTAAKDSAGKPDKLGYPSDKPETISDFDSVLDLTSVQGLVFIAIQVDDIATLTVKEIPPKEQPAGYTPIEKTYPLNGTALWSDKSYKEFPEPILGGRVYDVTLKYSNTANLTKQYNNGQIDIDGVNVFLYLTPIEVKWEKVGDNWDIEDNKDTDGNWMLGKGKRMFVDAKSQTETGMRDTVYVKVRAQFPQGTKVYLKAFDVDDPTPDPEYVIDPNDAGGIQRGNDNRGYDNLGGQQPPHFVSSGDVTVTCTMDAQGIARLDNGELPKLQMTDHPGDNVRVAVTAMNDSGLNDLQVGDSTQPGYVKPSDDVPQGFGGAISPMLTVWRKLNVEIDSMTAVLESGSEKNYEEGTITDVSTGPVTGQSKVTLNIRLTGPAYRYENGQLTIAGTSYDVISNTDNLRSGDDVIVYGLVPSSAKGQSFKIKDDDDNSLSELGLPASIPRNQYHSDIIKAIRPSFAPAYIQVEDAFALEINPNQTIPFKLNASAYSPSGSVFNDAKNLTDSAVFWAVTVTFGYQEASYLGFTDVDGDPDTENYERGSTPKLRYVGSTFGFTAIYTEAVRERAFGWLEPQSSIVHKATMADPLEKQKAIEQYYDLLNGTIAHEIGHHPGSQSEEDDHDEGGLMDGSGPLITTPFTAKTIRRFRNATSWTK